MTLEERNLETKNIETEKAEAIIPLDDVPEIRQLLLLQRKEQISREIQAGRLAYPNAELWRNAQTALIAEMGKFRAEQQEFNQAKVAFEAEKAEFETVKQEKLAEFERVKAWLNKACVNWQDELEVINPAFRQLRESYAKMQQEKRNYPLIEQ